jgi:heptose I phosphotransferase
LYLKKHHVRTWLSRLRAWLGIGPGETPARVEAENVRCLTAEGIDVMRVVAFGEKLHADGLCESFLLTEELHGYTDLREFLLRRFPPGSPQRGTARARDLDRLIRGVADVARRFHNAGYNHRDFYCCHFLVKETSPGEFDIRLIDLQRVQHRRRFRRRWLVKDLAQLAWSAPRDRVSCRQRVAFMRHYLGVRKLGPVEKRLIRSVLLKRRFMQWRLGGEP